MNEEEIRIVSIKEAVLSDNRAKAERLAADLSSKGTYLLDIMGSPGAGKTTFLLAVLAKLKGKFSCGVVEADIESTIDAQKMLANGFDAIQLRTGGACHIDIPMMEKVLASYDVLPQLLVLENVGNLVCPAEFETGAHRRVALLSVPEGHDKVFKYPLMFNVVDAVVVTKTDALGIFDDFDMNALEDGLRAIKPDLRVFKACAKTGEGIDEFVSWLEADIKERLA